MLCRYLRAAAECSPTQQYACACRAERCGIETSKCTSALPATASIAAQCSVELDWPSRPSRASGPVRAARAAQAGDAGPSHRSMRRTAGPKSACLFVVSLGRTVKHIRSALGSGSSVLSTCVRGRQFRLPRRLSLVRKASLAFAHQTCMLNREGGSLRSPT
jgi:hypothetical protein